MGLNGLNGINGLNEIEFYYPWGKMIVSRRPRAVDQRDMRLGGNGMEEKFSSSYLYDEWA
jgi:hypothetical protein